MGDRYNKKKAFERIKQMAKKRDRKHGRLSQKEIDREVMAVRHGKSSKLATALENLIKIDDEQVTSATWERHGKRWDKAKKDAVKALRAFKGTH